ncbi:MAG: hypothetical protein AAGC99_22190 [Pseudomonadota bacterium]
MTLLSFRAAAELAGCTATSIDRAVKSGALKVQDRDGAKGFVPNEVRIWAYRRKPVSEVAAASETFAILWTETVVWLAAESVRRAYEGVYQPGPIVREAVVGFTLDILKLDDDVKYAFSESISLNNDEVEKGFFDQTHWQVHDDLQTRLLFVLFVDIRHRLVPVMKSLSDFETIKKIGVNYLNVPLEDMLLRSFVEFETEIKNALIMQKFHTKGDENEELPRDSEGASA